MSKEGLLTTIDARVKFLLSQTPYLSDAACEQVRKIATQVFERGTVDVGSRYVEKLVDDRLKAKQDRHDTNVSHPLVTKRLKQYSREELPTIVQDMIDKRLIEVLGSRAFHEATAKYEGYDAEHWYNLLSNVNGDIMGYKVREARLQSKIDKQAKEIARLTEEVNKAKRMREAAQAFIRG